MVFVVILNELSAEFVGIKDLSQINTLYKSTTKCNNIVQTLCLGGTVLHLAEGTDYDSQPTSGFIGKCGPL